MQPRIAAYRKRGFDVYLVAWGDSARLQDFLTSKGITIPVLLDVSGDAGKAYRVQAIPETVFVDRNGRVHHRKLGWDRDALEEFEKQVEILTK